MKACQWPAPRPPGAEPLPPMPRPAPPPHVACSSPCLGFGVVVRQVPTRAVIVPVPKKRRGPPTAWTGRDGLPNQKRDRKSTRLNSSHTVISYAVFCLKKKKKKKTNSNNIKKQHK